jgi:hypothetical protein
MYEIWRNITQFLVICRQLYLFSHLFGRFFFKLQTLFSLKTTYTTHTIFKLAHWIVKITSKFEWKKSIKFMCQREVGKSQMKKQRKRLTQYPTHENEILNTFLGRWSSKTTQSLLLSIRENWKTSFYKIYMWSKFLIY